MRRRDFLGAAALAGAPLPKLAPNPLAEPDLAAASRHRIEFGGGMMGNMPGMGMMGNRQGMAWTVNDRPMPDNGHAHEPILSLTLGRSYPRTRAGIAFVADNPGNWMLHCHILEHQASGMMAVVRVA